MSVSVNLKKPDPKPVCKPGEIREVVEPIINEMGKYLDGLTMAFREDRLALWLDVKIGDDVASCSWTTINPPPSDRRSVRKNVMSAVRRAIDLAVEPKPRKAESEPEELSPEDDEEA